MKTCKSSTGRKSCAGLLGPRASGKPVPVTIGLLLFLFCVGGWWPLLALPRTHQVTIHRDKWGVPHVEGATLPDVAYGLAWVQAEDRFRDVQYRLLSGRGRLAEAFGPDAAGLDYLFFFLELDKRVATLYEQELSPAFKRYLEGYVQGLNDYARAHPKAVVLPQALPFEVEDVVRAWLMTLTYDSQALQLLQNLLRDRTSRWLDSHQRPSAAGLALALAPTRTATGETWLLAKPRGPLDGFMSWHEAHLYTPTGELNIHGATFPGLPVLLMGATPHHAWGLSPSTSSQMEVLRLRANPNNPNLYEVDDQWRTLGVRKAPIKLNLLARMGLAGVRQVYSSIYGPTIKSEKGRLYALRLGWLHSLKHLEQTLELARATSLDRIFALFDQQPLPLYNLVGVHRSGRIYHQAGGLVTPACRALQDEPPLMRRSLQANVRFLTAEALGRIVDPECGYLVQGGSEPVGPCAAQQATQAQAITPTERYLAQRFVDWAGRPLLWDSLQSWVQAPAYLLDAPPYQQLELLYQLDPTRFPDLQKPLELLQAWNGRADADNRQAALFLLTCTRLLGPPHAGPGPWLARETVQDTARLLKALGQAAEYLQTHFKRLDPSLGELQRLVRGQVTAPVGGLPGQPRLTVSQEESGGQWRAVTGDAWQLSVRYGPEEIQLRAVHPFGQTVDPASPHATDQMALYSHRKTRQVLLQPEAVRNQAVRSYTPGSGGVNR